MLCKLEELQQKDVINIKTGVCLGCVDDVTIDTCTAEVLCLVIFGRRKCFGLLGREDDIQIPWKDIKVIGDDAVLVCFEKPSCNCRPKKRRNIFSLLFGC